MYFSLRGPEYKLGQDGDGETDHRRDCGASCRSSSSRRARAAPGGLDGLTPEEIAQMLMSSADERRPGGDAGDGQAQSVQRFAGMEPGRPVGGTYYLYRTLRNLDLDGMLDKMMEQAREDAPDGDLTAARGAAREGGVRGPDREVQG